MIGIPELVSLLVAGIGVSFGFGKQAGQIHRLRQDVNEIANLHRETVANLQDLKCVVIEIKKDVEHIRHNQ